ncbi:MAG: hypothetical protein A2V65_01035 [Deltaproteobacteria bacterium RBG_13_49_15]|nr:MAG: hypothetical protein A2V65_01035 [Deltaproteobacteria bacterium RBG_13_49_15]
MGFFRDQEVQLAKRLLIRQCQKTKTAMPDDKQIEESAARFVDDAHNIAARRGKNVLAIIREMISDLKG